MSYLTITNIKTGETEIFGDKNQHSKSTGKPYKDIYGNYVTQETIDANEEMGA